jgi:hypothetical protein
MIHPHQPALIQRRLISGQAAADLSPPQGFIGARVFRVAIIDFAHGFSPFPCRFCSDSNRKRCTGAVKWRDLTSPIVEAV